MSSRNTFVFIWLPGLSIIPDVAVTTPSSLAGDRYAPLDGYLDSDNEFEPATTKTNINTNHHQQQIIEMLGGGGGIHHSESGEGVVSSRNGGVSLNRLISNRRKLSTASSSSSSSSSSTTSSARSSPQQSGMMAHLNNINAGLMNNNNKQNSEFVDFDEIAENPDSILLDFKCPLSDEKEVEWTTLFLHGSLYVQIPASCLPEGSRDSFISLLEFAEQKLECERVFVCFERKRIDRAALMRVFMFLGFAVVPPNNPMVPQNEEIMSMVYNID